MIKKNYKSDIDFILVIADGQGVEIGWPEYDWRARFYTAMSEITGKYVEASCIGGEYKNCFNDNGRIHIVLNNPHLGLGELKCEFHAMLPNEIYPDGVSDQFTPLPLGLELVRGTQSAPTSADIELTLPYIKGEPLRYEDLTEEQKAELQRPAIDAAKKAGKEACANVAQHNLIVGKRPKPVPDNHYLIKCTEDNYMYWVRLFSKKQLLSLYNKEVEYLEFRCINSIASARCYAPEHDIRRACDFNLCDSFDKSTHVHTYRIYAGQEFDLDLMQNQYFMREYEINLKKDDGNVGCYALVDNLSPCDFFQRSTVVTYDKMLPGFTNRKISYLDHIPQIQPPSDAIIKGFYNELCTMWEELIYEYRGAVDTATKIHALKSLETCYGIEVQFRRPTHMTLEMRNVRYKHTKHREHWSSVPHSFRLSHHIDNLLIRVRTRKWKYKDPKHQFKSPIKSDWRVVLIRNFPIEGGESDFRIIDLT